MNSLETQHLKQKSKEISKFFNLSPQPSIYMSWGLIMNFVDRISSQYECELMPDYQYEDGKYYFRGYYWLVPFRQQHLIDVGRPTQHFLFRDKLKNKKESAFLALHGMIQSIKTNLK